MLILCIGAYFKGKEDVEISYEKLSNAGTHATLTVQSGVTNIPPRDYQRGVNDALDSTMLLDLELRLKGEDLRWEDRCKVVAERLSVKRREIPSE